LSRKVLKLQILNSPVSQISPVNPAGQTHWLVFVSQYPPCIHLGHVISIQLTPSGASIEPAGQKHLNEPIVFMHS